MATGGKRAWLAAFAAATVACSAHAPPAGRAEASPPAPPPDAPPAEPRASLPMEAAAADPSVLLEAPEESAGQIELSSLLLARGDRPSLLRDRLLISGIDPHEVGQYLEAYNRRSELVQFTPDGVAFAPHALERMLSLSPDQLLQFRFSGQAGKLVFRISFK